MSAMDRAAGVWRDSVARVRKLSTMPAREVTSRVGYEAVTAFERRFDRRHAVSHLDRLARAVSRQHSGDWRSWLLDRRRERRAKFLPSIENRAAMQALFRTRYACAADATRVRADQTQSHILEFFGERFNCGAHIDWHADPQSGRQWPRIYHRDVPIHDPTTPFGDVKYVWELNRQQFIVDLGKLAFLDDTESHVAAVVALVRSWLDANPPGVGVSWACALEPAFRSFSWLWTYHLCLSSRGLDDESHLLWLAGLNDHGTFLYRHLEHYASPYNHLIGEASALYAIGVLFPEFRDAGAWRRRGRQVLESRLDEQFYCDGGSVEQSTFYHHATLAFYLMAALIGRANNEELADSVWKRLERALDFSMRLTQPDGSTPRIGGADDGKPIRLEHRSLWDFRAFLAAGAVLFDRPDMKYVAGDFAEDALWLLGPSGLARFEAMQATPPQDTRCALDSSGYYVFRDSWAPDASYLCFDCGEQADSVRRDGITNAVHGHADCLSVILWLGGSPILTDPGVFCYNGDPSWVSHFRRTAAHNTLMIDDHDQSVYHGGMVWSEAYSAHIEEWSSQGGLAYAMGSHDGYTRLPGGILHRRVAWLRPGEYAILWDEVTGAGAHELQFRFQFAPGAAELCSRQHMLFDGFTDIVWASTAATTADIRCGGPTPGDGWIAPSLGVRRPAPVLTIRAPFISGRVTLLTVLAHRRVTGGGPRVSIVREDACGTAVNVRGRSATDWIVSGEAGGLLPFETDGKLGVWSVRNGCVTEARAVGGRRVRPFAGEQIDDRHMVGASKVRA